MIDIEELANIVKRLSQILDCNSQEIVNSLIGVAWDEEMAGDINQRIIGKRQ
tara:strand:- start:90880 stop:91035 length:156 start_codon:yes stop_codon:yes gene_type:complete